jgi:hypothetical protein
VLVVCSTLASGGRLFDMPSFQLESDGGWRLTGYAPRQSQSAAASLPQVVKP